MNYAYLICSIIAVLVAALICLAFPADRRLAQLADRWFSRTDRPEPKADGHQWICLLQEKNGQLDTCERCGLMRYQSITSQFYLIRWSPSYSQCTGSSVIEGRRV